MNKNAATTEDAIAPLFAFHDSNATNLTFKNTVVETMDANYLNYEFIYNGSGVATGDINNDGLPDIYFAGNSSDDKLYINEGNLKFKDISETSGIAKLQGWSTGVTMVDINADGWLDIYVCRSGPSKSVTDLTNRLYINNKDNTFTEAAAEYGLASAEHSIQSAFFDYDLDGDLDMYLLNHPQPGFKAKDAKAHMMEIKSGKIQTDVFYENVNGKFVDKSKEAGLVNFGYRHGIAIGDINKDGYPDIYISSDFEEPDLLCINQGNKTFKNEIDSYFDHISFNSMGNEMVDINNDGLLDIYVVDMAPDDHFRSKAYMKSMDVVKFHGLKNNGYHSQYMFNTMHVNNGNNRYNEVAQFSGTAKTDWSWAPLFFDMDHDGDKDLFITNGIKENFLFRDIQIEVNKRERSGLQTSLQDLLQIVPSDISENIFYQNDGNAHFENVSGKWAPPSLYNSNGIATADFDNDGDLDFVTNNMGTEATLYESLAANSIGKNSIKLRLKGPALNPQALGAKVEVTTEVGSQWQELYTTRGYLSSVDPAMVFGLKDAATASVTVIWPDGKVTTIPSVEANKTHAIDYTSAQKSTTNLASNTASLLKNVTNSGIGFQHIEDRFDDYAKQILLPHSQSNVGPAIVKADVNGDGNEDLFIGGAAGQAGVLYIQSSNGFSEKTGDWKQDAAYEDTGAIFFDSDGDGDMDLYVVSGGAHLPEGSPNYQDRLYLNDGAGNFKKAIDRLPALAVSGQAVVSSDIDGDGDIDLFVGGRIIPDKYPYAPKSYFLMNENGRFTQKELATNQLIADALFSDYDGDGDEDLIVVGEWSPIKIFNNNKGEFTEAKIDALANTTGLWFGLAQNDIDGDGDMDYFVGNLGLNAKFKVSDKKEFHIYAYDFDNNGTNDVVLSGTYQGKLVPSRGRECSSQQMPFIKDKFLDYRSFANATLEDVYGEKLKEALHYKADMMYSVFLENKGNGNFEIKKLPWQAQLSPLSGFAFADVNNDGNNEIITVGNLYNVEVETVRYDASKGSVLSYANGNFSAIPFKESGFATSGDAREVITIKNKERTLLVVTNNNGKVDVFSLNGKGKENQSI
ncbi:VCBS repeat protein [Ulvibacter sp. MAR_2010_11]|nr:VCBS repeat protein [Ulvibacter sp. MAR_2010_11]